MVCSSPSSTRPPTIFSTDATTLRRTSCWKESVVTYQASAANAVRLKTQKQRNSFQRMRRRWGVVSPGGSGEGSVVGSRDGSVNGSVLHRWIQESQYGFPNADSPAIQ